MRIDEVKRAAQAAGISVPALERAKKKVAIVALFPGIEAPVAAHRVAPTEALALEHD